MYKRQLTDVVRKAGEATGLQVVKNEQLNVRYFAQSDNQALAVFRVANSIETPQWNKDIPNTERYIKARQESLGQP